MKKMYYYFLILLLSIIYINLIINQSVSHSSFNSLSQFSVSGKINSGIFNLYVEEKDKVDIPNIYNYSYTCNKTIINEINQTMNLSAINIKITNLQDPPYSIIINRNTTNSIFAVNEQELNAKKPQLAQYFKIDNFSLIQTIGVYLNYTVSGFFPSPKVSIDIYNASNFNV